MPQPNRHSSRPVSARIFLVFLLSAGLFAIDLFMPGGVEAQPRSPKSMGGMPKGYGDAPPMPGGSGVPGMGPSSGSPGAIPGMGPGGGMMMPGMGKGIIKKGAKKRDLSGSSDAVDNEKLPPGYRVPQEPPEALTTNEEWIVELAPDISDPKKKAREESRMVQKYRTIISDGEFTKDEDKEIVRKVLTWKLANLTRKEHEFRDRAHLLRDELLREIKNNPSGKGKPRTVRKFMLETITAETPRLFDYHIIARLQAAIILAELSDPAYNEEEAQPPSPAKPCLLALDPLTKMVRDTKQLTAVRIWGVNGLVRLGLVPQVKQQLKSQIVETLVELLNKSSKEHEWYQWRLVEGLGRLNVIQGPDKRPIVPQALAQVLADPDRSWLVRSEAAQSLGRLPLTQDLDVGLLAFLTAQLTEQMTEIYNKQPQSVKWKICYVKLYGAFKPIDDEDGKQTKRGLLTQVEKGTLASHKKMVAEAFDLVLPLVAKVATKPDSLETAPEGMEEPLSSLKKWLESNTPKNFKIHPDEDPIAKKQSNTGDRGPLEIPQASSGGIR